MSEGGMDMKLVVILLHVAAGIALLCAVGTWAKTADNSMHQTVYALWEIKALLWAAVFELGVVNARG